jgi:DNA repair protein RecO (recombination protein O)
MPGLYRDEAIVLKTIKLGEADRIVTVFTRGHGKVRAVAKGIRKTKSRFGGRLEPFSRVDLMLYKGKGALDTITAADILSSFDELRADYARLTAGAVAVEVVEKITEERERSPSVYALLLAGLESLAQGRCDNVVPAFLVKLLSLSGYHPQLQVCVSCGTGALLSGFSAAAGGAVCEECGRVDRGAQRLAPDRIALLARLLTSDFGYPSDPQAGLDVTAALRSYAEYHLERPLKSLRFLVPA